jgi:hypothetical protein
MELIVRNSGCNMNRTSDLNGPEQGKLFTSPEQRLSGYVADIDTSSLPAEKVDDGVTSKHMSSSPKRDDKAVIGDLKKVLAPFEGLTRIKLGTAGSLDELEKALSKVRTGQTMVQSIDGLLSELRLVLADAVQARAQESAKAIAAFVREVKDSGIGIRESAGGFRVGELELLIRKNQFRFQYNSQPLRAKWEIPRKSSDISRIWNESKTLIKKFRIEEALLGEMFAATYEQCRSSISGSGDSRRVMIQDFYKEFRITQARHDVNRKADKVLTFPEFPLWAFLYNLDLYIAHAGSTAPEIRLALETGSQNETNKSGYVTNGQNPQQDYKMHVFLVRY